MVFIMMEITPTIPSNWDKITIENYVGFMKSFPKKGDKPKASDLLTQQIVRAGLITGCEPEQAENLKLADYAKVNQLARTPLPQKLVLRFKLKDIKYRLLYQSKHRSGGRLKEIERLNPNKTLDARQMDGGEYAAQMNVIQRGHLDGLHQIMFNLCEPIKWGFRKQFPFVGYYGYEFTDYETEDRINDFKSLPMDVANPASVFFCRVSNQLTITLVSSSIQKTKKIATKMKTLENELKAASDGLA